MGGISVCRKGTLAVAQSIMLSPDKPKRAAVACPGSRVRFTGIPSVPKACVATLGWAIQYEKVAAFTKKRIASVSALIRIHSRRVFVPEILDAVERLARFRTCRPCPATKSVHKCAFSGIYIVVPHKEQFRDLVDEYCRQAIRAKCLSRRRHTDGKSHHTRSACRS